MARPYKFPDPTERSPKAPAVMCAADRVLALYNQDSGEKAERISKSVREWFFAAAHEKGWTGVDFLPEVQTNHGAGCVLWVGELGETGEVKASAFLLVDSADGED